MDHDARSRRVVIVGAAGRDFHNFNVVYRDDPSSRVVVYDRYPHIGRILPAVGYDDVQLAALAETLRRADCDVIVSASPIDLSARVSVDKPIVRARYEYADAGQPTLGGIVDAFLAGPLHARRAVRADEVEA